MLPGKKLTPEDFLKIAWRRKWLIVVPAVVISLVTVAVSQYLPNRYRASTTVLIVPQRVPTAYVRPTAAASIDERLQIISQQILSRTRLERIIQEFNLYAKEREQSILEDVIGQMRADINVAISTPRRGERGSSSFRISFESGDARTAMIVTERLASLFVQENLEDRELLADATDQFLQSQLEEAKRRLMEHEKRVEQFRQRNNGQLPDQVQSNLQLMGNAQARLQALGAAYNQNRDRLSILEGALADASVPQAPGVVSTGGIAELESIRTGTAAQQLESTRSALRALEVRLKPDHPDVARAKRLIEELEAKAEAEALAQPLSTVNAAVATTPAEQAAQNRTIAMRTEMEDLQKRMSAAKEEEARLQKVIESYSAKVQVAPGLTSELTELNRDYGTVQQTYVSLLQKSEESKITVNLERRQIGEQFKILDGARLPERPVSPNRVRINLMGILGGLALGLGLAGLLEYRDTSYKTDEDVMTTLALPVLAVIPVMMTAIERRRLKRRRLVLASSASVLGLIGVLAVAVWRLRLLDTWIR